MVKTEKGKKKVYCKCGYTATADTISKIHIKGSQNKKIEVVSEKDNTAGLPLTDTTCPKCGHKKAYYWLVQTRAGDEAETRFFKCEKCGHTWREYD